MVKSHSTSRFLDINNAVILTQTDTTVGLLSQNASQLREIKSRSDKKPFIKVFQNFQALKTQTIRIPKKRKNLVRRAKKTTFIVKNQALRVTLPSRNSQVLRNLLWSYSTSANESAKPFSRGFCEQKADIIIEDKEGLFEGQASKLYKINNLKIKRLR